MKNFMAFATDTLVPAARAVLLEKFAAYKSGQDIDITGKKDGSPASRADREAEAVMRALIMKEYPSHGIIGEEHGSHLPQAEYVWVLDPLDGTREFLDRQAGWCILIALMHNGRPALGVIDDPLEGLTVSSLTLTCPPANDSPLNGQSLVACTYPATMFSGTPWERSAHTLFAQTSLQPRLNGLGFSRVATGMMDLAVEAGLKLHDIAALLPILWAADAQTLRFDGSDYRDHIFNLLDPAANYELITGRNRKAAAQAFDILKSGT